MTTGLGDSGLSMQENARDTHGRVTHVELKGLTAFEIHWDGGEELGQKRWSLEVILTTRHQSGYNFIRGGTTSPGTVVEASY